MALWTEAVALAPSPVAAATRFIEPEWTSPTANTPGMLVSNGSGRRPGVAQAGPRSSPVSWTSVRMKPSSPGSDPGQPARGGLGADEAEQARARLGLRGVRRPVGDADFLE